MEIIIGIVGLVVSIGLYWAGKRHGESLERERQAHERFLQQDERMHQLASKAADDYVQMARLNQDSGPHALGTLALHLLASDELIRNAIHEMYLRSGNDPWNGKSNYLENIDLVHFFTYVKENKVDFFSTSVENAAKAVKEHGGLRKSAT